jgi:hypothetical protein
MDRFPLLPLEEEGQLNDMGLRENFIERVLAAQFGCDKLHDRMNPNTRRGANAGKRDWEELTAEYGARLMEGLTVMGCKRSDRGQACERAPALDGLPEESPVERRQRLPKVGAPSVGWSSWASSRTIGKGWCH